MKKALAVIMAAAMTVSLAGCGGSSSTTATTTEAQADTTAVAAESGSGETEAAQGDFKIGIITATVSQSEEEYRAAESVKEKYGEVDADKNHRNRLFHKSILPLCLYFYYTPPEKLPYIYLIIYTCTNIFFRVKIKNVYANLQSSRRPLWTY